ncbi:DUF302 domain-containing protein [Labrenzia aggregata]|uniref:DUF302 domain-containing protein n=1 Tax=Roseibium aggregatum TaxID=187304 RepID=A0A926P6L3_9HYPH|nr:DUF302 domain-containing protein [Roseibium aggregatum]
MKKENAVYRLLRQIVIILALVSAVGPAQASGLESRPGWRVISTGFAFGDLVRRVKDAVRDEKMLLVTQASASDGAKGQGIVIPGNRIMGVYRNDYARRMLKASVAAGIEAPIRYYVTENPDGTATLSWKTPSHVFAPYMEEGGAELKALATELDSVFEAIAAKAVGN